jgi:hypothetical protein
MHLQGPSLKRLIFTLCSIATPLLAYNRLTDEFLHEIDQLEEETRQLESRLKPKTGRLEMLKKMSEEVKNLEKEIQTLNARCRATEKALAESRESESAAVKKLQMQGEEFREHFAGLKKETEIALHQSEEQVKRVKLEATRKMKDVSDEATEKTKEVYSKYSETLRELKDIQSSHIALEKEQQKTLTTLQNREDQLASLSDRLLKTEATYGKKVKELEHDTTQKIRSLEAALNEKQNQLATLSKQLGETARARDEATKQMADRSGQFKSFSEKADARTKDMYEKYTASLHELKAAQKQIASLEKDQEKTLKTLEEREKQIAILNEKIEKIDELATKQIASRNNQIKEVYEKADERSREIYDKYVAATQELKGAQIRLTELEGNLQRAYKTTEERDSQIRTLHEKLQVSTAASAEADNQIKLLANQVKLSVQSHSSSRVGDLEEQLSNAVEYSRKQQAEISSLMEEIRIMKGESRGTTLEHSQAKEGSSRGPAVATNPFLFGSTSHPVMGSGQSPSSEKKNPETEKLSYLDFMPKRMAVRHVQGWGEGIGYGTDYTTVTAMFAPEYRLGGILPMLDLRVHRFDNNTYAANVGIAGRYIPNVGTFCEMLGFNLFYDYRQGFKGAYNQIGAGIEVLGRRWDFRANAYYPLGAKVNKNTCVFDDYEGGYIATHRTCEFTTYGFNAEVGYLAVPDWHDFLFYAAIGPYYLARRCHDETLGGKVRIRPQYKDYVALDLSYSYDPVFRSVFQAEVIISLPLYQIFGKKGSQGPCGITDRQIYQPIERFEVMPLGRSSCWVRNF